MPGRAGQPAGSSPDRTRGKTQTGRKPRVPGPALDPVLRARARSVFAALTRAYPDARCALQYQTPLDLFVATVLSAQCTDARVNRVTPELFARCRRPEDYLALGQSALEEKIRSTGFFRNKAKSILGACRAMLEEFGGRVPDNMEELLRLPGVGRKTANVLLGEVFGTPGITVDTHVGRVARRLELTRETDPVKVEFALMPLFPRKDHTRLSHLLIEHGRACCYARDPACARCPILRYCPFPGRVEASARRGRPAAGKKKTTKTGTRKAPARVRARPTAAGS